LSARPCSAGAARDAGDLDRIEAALAELREPPAAGAQARQFVAGIAQTSFLSQVREALVPGL